MEERLERSEGLRALARIIARAYLADVQRGLMADKAIEGKKKSESVSRTKRNSPNRKRGK